MTAKLYTYSWQATNLQGQQTTGEVIAKTVGLAKAELYKQGIIAQKIKRKRASLFSLKSNNITAKQIALLIRQLSTLLNAGIPLLQAFDILEKGQVNKSLQTLLHNIKTDIAGGLSLATAFSKQARYFDVLFCNLIHAGEQSGTLDVMLNKLAIYKEKVEKIKVKIKKALLYPSIVFIAAMIVTALLLILVVPQFKNLFAGLGAELPSFTLLILKIADYLQQAWWSILLIFFMLLQLLLIAFKKFTAFRYRVDYLLLHLPILGKVLRQAAIARYARTLAITSSAGLPLIDALSCTLATLGNLVYQTAVLQIREQVTTGLQLHIAMQACRLFPIDVLQMVAVGEESGTLDAMLSKIADAHEEDVDNIVDNLSNLLEPLVMVILGLIMGSLIIAMYLPIFKLGSVV